MGSYALNQHQAPNEMTITVVCERGTVRFEMHRGCWSWMDRPETPWHDEPCDPPERDALFTRQANAFLDAIEGTAPPACTLAEGIATLKVNLAILRASEQQRWETIS
jgi:predicted dehydrogenase